jgi:nucleoside-diphosphate-sugar epimerase
MRVVVIGATGHIGTYLVPRLVAMGHEVVALSRGRRAPYQGEAGWGAVRRVVIDRDAEERAGTFGARVRELRPEVVIDLICFRLESCRALVEALRGEVRHFLHCGTIWVYGPTEQAPTTESAPRRPIDDYGTQKAAIEAYLLEEAQRRGFPATVLHPGHIVGPGWAPINPAGNLDLGVFAQLAKGEEVALPDHGMATLHHVHADDVAQAFTRAIERWSASVGEAFHVVSPAALTLRGYARAVASWFDQEARLTFLPWEEWRRTVTEEQAQATWGHIEHSPCSSCEKARALLGYTPRYSSLEAVREALTWLIDTGRVAAPSLTAGGSTG